MAVGFDHHGHGVPAHVSAQAFFDFDVARAMCLLAGFDGVDVASVGRERHVNAALAGMLKQLLQQKMCTLRPLRIDHGGQRIHPFTCLLGVCIIRGKCAQVVGLC